MDNKKLCMRVLVIMFIFCMSVIEIYAQSTSGGTFTLTNIPSRYNGMYAILIYDNAEDIDLFLYGAMKINNDGIINGSHIVNSEVVLPMWVIRNDENIIRYTGNSVVSISILLFTKEAIEAVNYQAREGYVVGINFKQVRLRNGSARKSWNDADYYY